MVSGIVNLNRMDKHRKTKQRVRFGVIAERKSENVKPSIQRIMTHSASYSDNWKFIDWKKLQKILFRLQRRIFVRFVDGAKLYKIER